MHQTMMSAKVFSLKEKLQNFFKEFGKNCCVMNSSCVPQLVSSSPGLSHPVDQRYLAMAGGLKTRQVWRSSPEDGDTGEVATYISWSWLQRSPARTVTVDRLSWTTNSELLAVPGGAEDI